MSSRTSNLEKGQKTPLPLESSLEWAFDADEHDKT